MLDSNYIKALEKRAGWLRWAYDDASAFWYQQPGFKDDEMLFDVSLPLYRDNLQTGDTFFMNRNFCQLVDHARTCIPDDLVFDSTWMQARDGWMYLEIPFEVPTKIMDKDGNEVTAPDQSATIAAVGWKSIPEGANVGPRLSPRIAGKGAIEFMCYMPFLTGFACWSYFMLQDGDKVAERCAQFENALHFGIYQRDVTEKRQHEMRWIYAAFYLMAQRLSINVKHETDRHTRRRGERTSRPVCPFIRVVTLRRQEEDRKKEGATQVIDWQWQWEVRGHWRNQYFPATGEHRPVFIEAFIKGPENKPLKPDSHRIFVARR